MLLLLIKCLHFIGIIFWFAAMFYLSRTIAAHKRALQSSSENGTLLSKIYAEQEWNIYKSVMTPAMVLTWIAGLTMLYLQGYEWFKLNHWMHFKILFLLILSAYHGKCKSVIRDLTSGKLSFNDRKFDFFIDFPFLILIFIVPLSVFKINIHPLHTVLYALLGVIILIITKAFLQKSIK
jgi:protoporphyrinogen IX oxidase